MFDSLDEQMKHDDIIETTSSQRLLKWAAVIVISIVVFGGLYLTIQLME